MPIKVLEKIAINNNDIDEVEKLLGNVTFDDTRRSVIKNMDTVDIQAFPGSGKTTILIAKLAILAKKWTYANKGICVLSHTNVAREEIENRLGTTAIGKKLISYPHFIGTLHPFFDSFIGIPWLRSNGFPITVIDTEIVLSKRWSKLQYKTKSYLERIRQTEYCCESKDYPVEVNIPCASTTQSYVDVKKCIEMSFSEGYFTFSEMLYVAKHGLNQCNAIANAVQSRFPILLIDEAQDTSDIQWQLIDSAFPDKTLSIKQAYGDGNQAIFHSHIDQEDIEILPKNPKMTITNSKRFGEKIAKLVDPLSVAENGIQGEFNNYKKNDSCHTIFIFNRKNSCNVLPAYARHLLTCFSDEELQDNHNLSCYAIGMVHNKEPMQTTNPHFPASLCDYWNSYNPQISSRMTEPKHLVEYFRLGREEFIRTNDIHGLIEWVAKGIKRYININSNNHIPATSNAFSAIIKQIPVSEQLNFRKLLKEILIMPIIIKLEWSAIVTKIHNLVDNQFAIKGARSDILDWTLALDDNGEEKTSKDSANCFRYTDTESERSVCIHLGSIHSVKGRTHLATLVVETYWHNHNIYSILPWLYNNPPKGKRGVRNTMRLKCHYVALSRAKGLICIALPSDDIKKDEISKLQTVGWNIIELQ